MTDIAAEIKRLVPMTQAAPFYGVEIGPGGFCRCPFHGERTGSMKVYDGERGWHCFGCHEGGSVIDFVMKLHGLSFVDAEKRLDADFRLGLFQDEQDAKARQRAARAARERQKALEERDRQHMEIWTRYNAALEAFCRADRLAGEAATLKPFQWTAAHEEALRTVDGLYYEAQKTQAELTAFEHQNHVSGPPRPGGEKLIE